MAFQSCVALTALLASPCSLLIKKQEVSKRGALSYRRPFYPDLHLLSSRQPS